VLLIGQRKMNGLILEELKKHPCVRVRVGQRVVGTEDIPSQQGVKVMAHEALDFNRAGNHDGGVMYEARYVIGTDGANSAVRRMLCIVRLSNVPISTDYEAAIRILHLPRLENDRHRRPLRLPQTPRVHTPKFHSRPHRLERHSLHTGEDENGSPYGTARPQWRVAYPEDPNLPGDKESIMERAYESVKPFIDAGDGKDGKGEFTITRAEPYVQRQRVAATGRKDRVLLAGDALHSNNPIGGLGLTSGICDAFCYGNALVRVINDGEDDGVLTHCSESRRWAWINATNVMSVANLKRLQSFEPEDIKKRNEFFEKFNTDNNFPAQVRKGMNGLMIDSF